MRKQYKLDTFETELANNLNYSTEIEPDIKPEDKNGLRR